MIAIQVASQSTAFRAGIHVLLGNDPGFRFLPDRYPGAEPEPPAEQPGLWVCSQQDLFWLFEVLGTDLQRARGLMVIGVPLDSVQSFNRLNYAWGVLPESASDLALKIALAAVDQGLAVGPPEFIQQVRKMNVNHAPQDQEKEEYLDALSPREIEVLRLISSGLQNKQIAVRLEISENTVKFHLSSIFSKLSVANRAEAVAKGSRLGLIAL